MVGHMRLGVIPFGAHYNGLLVLDVPADAIRSMIL